MKKTWTLKENVDVIKYKDKSVCGSWSLAEKFFIGKAQIISILKNQDKILLEFETSETSSKKKEVLVKQIMKKLTNWSKVMVLEMVQRYESKKSPHLRSHVARKSTPICQGLKQYRI